MRGARGLSSPKGVSKPGAITRPLLPQRPEPRLPIAQHPRKREAIEIRRNAPLFVKQSMHAEINRVSCHIALFQIDYATKSDNL